MSTSIDDKEARMTAWQAQREAEEAKLKEKRLASQAECEQRAAKEEACRRLHTMKTDVRNV